MCEVSVKSITCSVKISDYESSLIEEYGMDFVLNLIKLRLSTKLAQHLIDSVELVDEGNGMISATVKVME